MATNLFNKVVIGFLISFLAYAVLLLTEREAFPFHVFFGLAILGKLIYIIYNIKKIGTKNLWTKERRFDTLF